MMIILKKFLNDENGATAIEYGLIASLVGVVIIGSVDSVGSETYEMWTYIRESINGAIADS